MREYFKNYIFVFLRFLIIFYLTYKLRHINENIEYLYIIKILFLFFLELLEIYIFYNKKIYSKYLRKLIGICFLTNFLIIESLTFFKQINIEFFIYFIILLSPPMILYLFISFLLKQENFYVVYTGINLFYFILFLFLTSSELPLSKRDFDLYILIVIFYVMYIIITSFYFILYKEDKKKFTFKKEIYKKNFKILIFIIFHFFINILLIYKTHSSSSIYYIKTIIFISFELFGILIFYLNNNYIKFLKKTLSLYILFCFIFINIFDYLGDSYIEILLISIVYSSIFLILAIFIYSIIKKEKFYFIYSIILLLWEIFFNLLNIIGNTEAWTYELNLPHILIAYIVISFLYAELFKKNKIEGE